MPLRSPHKDESQKDFMSYCMGELKDTGREQDQMVAICLKAWREGPKDEKSESGIGELIDRLVDVIKVLATHKAS